MNTVARRVRLSIFDVTLIFLLAITALSQSIPKSDVGAQFKSVQTSFETEVNALPKTRGPSGYDPASVNVTLRRTKEATLSPIPRQDTPLREYVERSFPQPVDETSEGVSKAEVEGRFTLVRELLAKLSHLDSFRFDLSINTIPPKARFDLVPRVGAKISSATNSRLTNVYRGEYDYYITKTGFKPVHETINFIERSGTRLDCELQPDPSADEPLPCKFQ